MRCVGAAVAAPPAAIPGLVAAFVVLGLLVPFAAAQDLPAGPTGIHLAYGADASTEVRVSWGGGSAQSARVEYGVTDAHGSTADASAVPVAGDVPFAYTARLEGLAAATAYHYRVVLDAAASADHVFRTGPAVENASIVRVAAWADHGVPDTRNPAGESDGDSPLATRDLALGLAPDAHLVAGDISYANGFPGTWDAYLAAMEPYLAETPYMVVPGNHEREPGLAFRQYDDRFAMPSAPGERWYSFRLGPVLFLGMDSERACAPTPSSEAVPLQDAPCDAGADPAQLAFLRTTLETAARDPTIRWTVAYHHYPVWSTGPHGPYSGVVEHWAPVYEAAGVDLVLNGHDHLYERSKPIRNGTVAAAGTTYVVVGTGGASHYEFASSDPPEWEAARNSEDYGVLLLAFSDESVRGEFHVVGGAVKDNFTLVQDARGFARLATAADLQTPPTEEEAERTDSPAPAVLLLLAAALLLASRGRRRSGRLAPEGIRRLSRPSRPEASPRKTRGRRAASSRSRRWARSAPA